jgi:serine/threonine-protein kinase HipA
VAGTLSIWLYGMRVAVVEQGSNRRLRLRYTEEARGRFGLGTPLLSLNLPVVDDPFPNARTRAFLDGLLPEGETRATLAAEFDLVANDTFGLLRELGRDCAGALVVQPEELPAPEPATTLTAAPLSEADLDELVRGLRTRPLGVSDRVRLSLAGVQDKLLLTRMPDGSWGRPIDGTPSTHILKPPHPAYRNTVENEAFCMRVAKYLGLPVAEVEITSVQGRKLLVVERFDRRIDASGAVTRVHQEDLCQALGIAPKDKYQEDGGRSLRKVADVLVNATDPSTLETLLRVVTLNVALGNADAHGKNFALLHLDGQTRRMAPIYDAMSTLAYESDGVTTHMAMYVDSVQRIDRVTTDRIVAEAAAWGLSRALAAAIVAEVLQRLPMAVEQAAQEIDDLPVRLLPAYEAQMERLTQTP